MNWKSRWVRWTLAGIVLAGVIVIVYRRRAKREANAPAAAVMQVGPENIAIVLREPLVTGPGLTGTITPLREARLRSELSGTVTRTLVLAGQPVRRGDTLATLDDIAVRDQWLSARSGQRVAQQALDDATRDFDRSTKLQAAGAVADRDLENAKRGLMIAEAQAADATSRLALAQQQIDRTRFLAPFSGIVSEMAVKGGDVVTPGGAVATVVDPASMRLEGSVPAEQVSSLRVGAAVQFRVNGYPDRVFMGKVDRINPTADPATRQVRVYVSIPNEGGALVGGLFAQGRVATSSRMSTTAPLSAVDDRGTAPSVMRLAKGRAERVIVKTGLRDPETDRVELLEGVAPGDTLLIGAAQGLTAGTAVKVTATPSDRAAGAASAAARATP
jgi:membrane fusion protein (multidrug efflux system)